MYTIAKLTDEPKAKGTGAVRGRDGVLLTEPDSIRARWVDHCSGLLNVPSEVDMSVMDHVEQRPVAHALDASISMAEVVEVVKACQQLKNSKAPGVMASPQMFGSMAMKSSSNNYCSCSTKHGARELYRKPVQVFDD